MLTTRKEKIGHLDRRITLKTRTVAVDAYGGGVETFADLAEVWAKVEYPITDSGEDYVNAVNLVTQRIDFTIRHRTDLDFVDRIVYDSKIYDIERIAEVGRDGYLKITATLKK